jgi:hypothetical protein
MYGIVIEISEKNITTWTNPEDQEEQKCLLPSDNKTDEI